MNIPCKMTDDGFESQCQTVSDPYQMTIYRRLKFTWERTFYHLCF